MNKFLIMIMTTMNIVGIAYADENPSPYSLNRNNWTGLYAGMNAGVLTNHIQLKSQQLGFTNPSGTCDLSSDFSSFSPGIQLGYLHQFPNYLVSGIEANATFNTNQKDRLSCQCPFNSNVSDSFSFKNQRQNALKARMGLALTWKKSLLLPYLTAGVSFATVGLTYENEGGDYDSKNIMQAGWLLGAGIELAVGQHWSLRAEYAYADYGNTIKLNIPSVYGLADPNGNARANLNSNNVALALNYWIE